MDRRNDVEIMMHRHHRGAVIRDVVMFVVMAGVTCLWARGLWLIGASLVKWYSGFHHG